VDTLDLVALRWCPDNTCIAIQDTSLSYNLQVAYLMLPGRVHVSNLWFNLFLTA
jgi:hypothetical protein